MLLRFRFAQNFPFPNISDCCQIGQRTLWNHQQQPWSQFRLRLLELDLPDSELSHRQDFHFHFVPSTTQCHRLLTRMCGWHQQQCVVECASQVVLLFESASAKSHRETQPTRVDCRYCHPSTRLCRSLQSRTCVCRLLQCGPLGQLKKLRRSREPIQEIEALGPRMP